MHGKIAVFTYCRFQLSHKNHGKLIKHLIENVNEVDDM